MLRISVYFSCLLRHRVASAMPLPGNSCSQSDVTENTSNNVPYASKARALMEPDASGDPGSGSGDPAFVLCMRGASHCRMTPRYVRYYGVATHLHPFQALHSVPLRSGTI